MKEITELLKRAHSSRRFWGTTESFELLGKFKDLGCESDWEEDESWVRISVSGSVSAMFSTSIPLAFVSAEFPFYALLQNQPFTTITTSEAFSERGFLASKTVLEEVFNTTFSEAEFDPTAFSISDLWYQTVDS